MNKILVALVIGHSNKSRGAYNKDMNIHEYDLNKTEVLAVDELLKPLGIDSVIVHRDTYNELPNDINRSEPDFIISFHHNAYSQSSTGTETLYYHKSAKGKVLADTLQKRIVETLGYKDRGIKAKTSEDRGGYLLKYTQAPCVILEPCFISNDKELTSFMYKQKEYIDAVVSGILDYIKIQEES